MNRFDKQYADSVRHILRQPAELNQRTNHAVRAQAGMTIRVDLEKDGFPLLSLRKMPWSFVPEVMWMLSGVKDLHWLSQHTKIWDSFAEEDGTVTAAYGNRWRNRFGVDQLAEVIQKLDQDPSSRHGVVMAWDPATDLTVPQKNVPCPVMFTLNVIAGRLNMHLVVRSNDMALGHPTDVAGYALLTHMLAQRLALMPGMLTVSISNAHVYENQVPFMEELVSRETRTEEVRLKLPKDAYSRAVALDPSLIREIKDSFSGYLPGEPMKDIPIAM